MAPRNFREHVSETEGKPMSTSRASAKAKSAAAQQAQKEFLSKHITSNGTRDEPKVNPLDFNAFDNKNLDRYSEKYDLNLPPTMSINRDILQSEIGKKTYSYKTGSKSKVSKLEQANTIKKHFLELPARENEIITNFLYKVRNQDTDFKITFD